MSDDGFEWYLGWYVLDNEKNKKDIIQCTDEALRFLTKKGFLVESIEVSSFNADDRFDKDVSIDDIPVYVMPFIAKNHILLRIKEKNNEQQHE